MQIYMDKDLQGIVDILQSSNLDDVKLGVELTNNYEFNNFEDYEKFITKLGTSPRWSLVTLDLRPYTIQNIHIPIKNKNQRISGYRISGHRQFLYYSCLLSKAWSGELVHLCVYPYQLCKRMNYV